MQLTHINGFPTAKARNAEFSRLLNLINAAEDRRQLTETRSFIDEFVEKIRIEQLAYGKGKYDFDHAAEIVDKFMERLKLLNLLEEFKYENR